MTDYKIEDLLITKQEMEEAGFYGRACSRLINKNKKLEERFKKAVEVIQYYASLKNYEYTPSDSGNLYTRINKDDLRTVPSEMFTSKFMRVGGKRAMDFLEEIDSDNP